MEGGRIARKLMQSERNQPYIPSEAIPKSLNELTNQQWCARHYALYYLVDICKQSSILTTKNYSEENRIDMEKKVKNLLKELKIVGKAITSAGMVWNISDRDIFVSPETQVVDKGEDHFDEVWEG